MSSLPAAEDLAAWQAGAPAGRPGQVSRSRGRFLAAVAVKPADPQETRP